MFPGLPGLMSFFKVFQVEWELWEGVEHTALTTRHFSRMPTTLFPVGMGGSPIMVRSNFQVNKIEHVRLGGRVEEGLAELPK